MGQKDLEYAYERFKLDCDIIKPYTDEMEMVHRIQGYEAHFFPWRRWWLAALFSIAVFASAAIVWIAIFWIFGEITLTGVWDLVPMSFVGLGIIALILAIHLRGKYMVVSIDGISLPRVFGPNHHIPWLTINRIGYRASGLEDSINLTIETRAEKTKTNLSYYKIIYFARGNKALKLARALLAFSRLRVFGEESEVVRKKLEKSKDRKRLPEIAGGVVLFVWVFIGRGLMALYGFLLIIPVIGMAFPLFLIAVIGATYYEDRQFKSKMRTTLIVCIAGVVICLIIIVLMILPFFF